MRCVCYQNVDCHSGRLFSPPESLSVVACIRGAVWWNIDWNPPWRAPRTTAIVLTHVCTKWVVVWISVTIQVCMAPVFITARARGDILVSDVLNSTRSGGSSVALGRMKWWMGSWVGIGVNFVSWHTHISVAVGILAIPWPFISAMGAHWRIRELVCKRTQAAGWRQFEGKVLLVGHC